MQTPFRQARTPRGKTLRGMKTAERFWYNKQTKEGAVRIEKTSIEGLAIVIPQVFGDERGWFAEQYNATRYKAEGITADFVQDNESFSSKGVVRGLHWQAGRFAQAKLVRVVRGAVWDVAVDIRKGSPTYGRHTAAVLTGENKKQFFIPRGFAHGFIVLEDDTLFSYKCDNFYNPQSERGMLFSDPALAIEWPKVDAEPKLSPKDEANPLFADIEPWEDR